MSVKCIVTEEMLKSEEIIVSSVCEYFTGYVVAYNGGCYKLNSYEDFIKDSSKEVPFKEFLKVLRPKPTIITAYLNSSKKSMYDVGQEAGLTEKQLENFRGALYEVEFELSVDKDGNETILKVDGKPLCGGDCRC